MTEATYMCTCGRSMSYRTTKHNGCPDCGFVPFHGAD